MKQEYSGTRVNKDTKGTCYSVRIKRAVRENFRDMFYRYKDQSKQFYEDW